MAQTHKKTDGHGDSMTESVQWANSVKILNCWILHNFWIGEFMNHDNSASEKKSIPNSVKSRQLEISYNIPNLDEFSLVAYR